MIDIQDLMDIPLLPEIRHLDTKFHSLTLTSLIANENFDSTCNVNTRQLSRLIDNLDIISRTIKDYLADHK